MVYVPDDWIVDKANEKKVYELLKILDTDLELDDDDTRSEIIKELQSLGEHIILDKIESGELVFGA